MRYGDIKKLLEQRLNALSTGIILTAFENAPFTPVNGVAWQKCDMLPAKTQNPTMGDDFKRDAGIFQVTLAYPLNVGAGAAIVRAKVIAEGFKRGYTMNDGTLRVLIDESPSIAQGIPDGAWYKLPISIPYVADVYD